MHKKIIYSSLFLMLLSTSVAFSQKKTLKAPIKRTTAAPLVFKTSVDSISYAIGLKVANAYVAQGVKTINPTFLSKAINDVILKRTPALTEQQGDFALARVTNPIAIKNMELGMAFLRKNKSNAAIRSTASGLQYEVLTAGSGTQPTMKDTVVTHYAGRLIDGTEFDSSYKSGEPISFELTKVIKGWTEGVQLMPLGAKYRLYIPYNLAYGVNGRPGIPGGSTLIFDIELLNIKKSKQ